MTEGHCQNCQVYASLTKATSPNGETYWVCETCVPRVEEGNCRVVAHNG